MELNEQQIIDLIRSEIDKRDILNQYSVSKIPYHTHNGTDSIRINPIDLIGFPCVSVANSTVAPTDAPQNGTIRILYDTDSWNLWVRVNNLWKTASLS